MFGNYLEELKLGVYFIVSISVSLLYNTSIMYNININR